MDKKKLTEQDIRTKFITPAIVDTAGWDRDNQILEEYNITKGQILVRGNKAKRGKRKVADYVLFYRPNIPIAVVEAKDNNHSVGGGMQQALEYAELMDIPFAYSSNGDEFLEHDFTVSDGPIEKVLKLHQFPSPEELWQRYKKYKGIDDSIEDIITQKYHLQSDGDKQPRYYQWNAINRTIEAISKGQNRILLVMATGTGKTFTAFQIAWRLWKAGVKKRILFLVDRENIISQTQVNDFKPFSGKMTRISNRKVDKSYEVYMALYQGMTNSEEHRKTFKQFSSDFFDLIIVDECHRGSAKEDSEWREILDYFNTATQIGLTATPKETKYVSNISYFGEPIYIYSLKQGIKDGFLAPYKVIRVTMDKDDGWRPTKGRVDKFGKPVPDKVYNLRDYERELVIEHRVQVIAKRVTEFLKLKGRFSKTIIFCIDMEHAERMRQAMINENHEMVAVNRKYVVKMTSDSPDGKKELDNFIEPSEQYPVVATTSKLLSTGVDSRTCELIVIEKNIGSMTEFKQIIGRGTRVEEDYGKLFFTILDFRMATNLFADPDFDGEPVSIYEPKPNEPIMPPEPENEEVQEPEDDSGLESNNIVIGGNGGYITTPGGGSIIGSPRPSYNHRIKYYIDGVPVEILNERVLYHDGDGKLITESIRSYCKKAIVKEYKTLDIFIRHWTRAEQKKAIIEELEERGVFFEELTNEVGKDFDAFDLVCHVAFDSPPLTRRERAEHVKKRDYFSRFGETARQVMEALLEKYADQGIADIEDIGILKVHPFRNLGSPLEIIEAFGGKENFVNAVKEMEEILYNVA